MLFFFEHHGMDGKDFFRVSNLRDQAFPAHLHRAYEMIFINSGALLLRVEHKQYIIRDGEMAFISCNQIHSFSTPEHSDITVVLFSPETIGDFYSAFKDCAPKHNIIRPGAVPNFSELKSVYSKKSFLYRICDELLSATEMEQVGNRLQLAVLQQIFAYVDKNFNEDCSLITVAKHMKYDYSYLSKLFYELTGVHYSEYLNKYRISQACYLLKAGKHSISDIAARCGYSNLRTFHRNFRRIADCSPGEYVSAARNTKTVATF